MLAGERRIGKTTVCAAVCERLKSQGVLVIEVDVPERPDSRALLQLTIDACSRVSPARTGRAVLRFARPTIEKLLAEYGVPLDLSALGREPQELPARAVLSLTSWRKPLTERFSRAGLLLEDTPPEELLRWSNGRPYATMAAARYTAQSARRTSSDTATEFDVQMGIDEANRHLHDNGV